MSSADVDTPETETDADTDVPAAPAVAEGPATLLQELTEALGDAVVGSHPQGDDLTVRVTADAWHRAGEACRALGFDYFCFLSGLDWMPSTSPNPRASVSDTLDTRRRRRRCPRGRARRRPGGGNRRRGGHRRLADRHGRGRHPLPGLRPPLLHHPPPGRHPQGRPRRRRPPGPDVVRHLPRCRLDRARDVGDVRVRVRRPPAPGEAVPARRVRGLPPAQGLPAAVPRGQALARPGRRRADARGPRARGPAEEAPPRPLPPKAAAAEAPAAEAPAAEAPADETDAPADDPAAPATEEGAG